ncbi:hypothetical protein ABPG73_003947 [Tetrahymena malaccensis]
MLLTFEYLICVNIPVWAGIIFLIFSHIQFTSNTLYKWEELSTIGIKNNEQQRLHNYALSNKIFTESLFQSISQDLTQMINFVYKDVKYSQKLVYSDQFMCSNQNFIDKECSNTFLSLYERDLVLVELWFHVFKQEFNLLSQSEVEFFQNNYSRSFLSKAIYLTRKNQFISPEWIYHTLNTSLINSAPAKLAEGNGKDQICEQLLFRSFDVFYDPRCRDWYQQAINTVGQVFTKPYKFALDKKVGMTLSMRLKKIYYSVYSIDFSMSNLGNQVFQEQDNYDESSMQEGYTVLVHQENQTIFHHRYWSEQSNTLYSWPDIEYNSTTQFQQQDKEEFHQKIQEAIDFSHTKNYSIFDFENVEKFFIKFTKNNRKYVSVLYPIDIKSYQFPQNRTIQKSQIVLYIGRVHFDQSGLLNQVMMNARTMFVILNIIEAVLVLIIVIISFLHYAAVFIRKLDFQLEILIQYLKQQDENSIISNIKQQSKRNRRWTFQIINQVTPKTQYERKTVTQSYSNSQKSIKDDNRNEKAFHAFSKQLKQTDQIKSNSQTNFFKKMMTLLFKQKKNVKNLQNIKLFSNYEEEKIDIFQIQYEFYEMSILINSFQQLASVINLIKKGDQQIVGNISQKIMASSSAKQIFQSVNNNFGQGFCYFQLGQLYFQQRKYMQAAQNFEQSLNSMLIEVNIDDINQLSDKMLNGNFNATIYQCQILQQRLFFYILSLKEDALNLNKLNLSPYELLQEDEQQQSESSELHNYQVEENIQQQNQQKDQKSQKPIQIVVNDEVASNKELITEQCDEMNLNENENKEEAFYKNKLSNQQSILLQQKSNNLSLQKPTKYIKQLSILLQNKKNTLSNCFKYCTVFLNICNFIKKKNNQEQKFESGTEFSFNYVKNSTQQQKQLLIFIELAEIYTHISNFEQASYYIYMAEKIISLIQENFLASQDHIDFFQSKVNYIFGIICIKRKLYKLGCYCLVSCLEDTLIQEPIVIKRSLTQIQQVFEMFEIPTDIIDKQINKFQFLDFQSDSSILQPYFLCKNGKQLQETEEKQGFIDFLIVFEILPFESPDQMYFQKQISLWIQKNYICSKDRLYISFYCCSKLILTFQAKDFLNDRYFDLCIQQLRIEQLKLIKEYQISNPHNLNKSHKEISQKYYSKYENGWSKILLSSLEQFFKTQNSLSDQLLFKEKRPSRQVKDRVQPNKYQLKSNCNSSQGNQFNNQNSNQLNSYQPAKAMNTIDQYQQNRQLIQILFSFSTQKETLDLNFLQKFYQLRCDYQRKKIKQIVLQIPYYQDKSRLNNQNTHRQKFKKSFTFHDQKTAVTIAQTSEINFENQLEKKQFQNYEILNLQSSFTNIQKMQSPSFQQDDKFNFSEQKLFKSEKKYQFSTRNNLNDQFVYKNFNQERSSSPKKEIKPVNLQIQQQLMYQPEKQSNFYTENENQIQYNQKIINSHFITNNKNKNKQNHYNQQFEAQQNNPDNIGVFAHLINSHQKSNQNNQGQKTEINKIESNKFMNNIDFQHTDNTIQAERKLKFIFNQQKLLKEEYFQNYKNKMDDRDLYPLINTEGNGKTLTQNSIMVFEKQKLYNYVSANKIIADIQFQDISSDIYVLSKFYNKVQSGQVKNNPQALYQKCSMRDFQTSNIECPQYIQAEFSANRNYVDLWFHRTARIESQLNPIEKSLLQTNLVFITLAKGFYSVRKNSLLDEQWIYNTFNNSLMIGSPASTISLDFYYQDCMQGKFSEPYDPRCRPWYILAMKNEGIQFEQPYVYAFDNSIGMTASSKILDGKGSIQSVISIDFGITNLVNDVFSLQDQNNPSSIYEAYSVFFHKENRTIFYHRYWNRSSGDLYNWADIEYNQTSNYPKSEQIDFSDQLTNAIIESNTVDFFYNFNQILKTNLFMNFAKGDRNYTALVYPVETFSINQNNQIEMMEVMFIARVQRNIVDLILQDVLQYNTLFEALVIVEICFVSVILIISLFHFTAVLMHQIAIPLTQLTNFLKHSSLLIKQQKANEVIQINNQLQTQQKQQINQSLAFSTQFRLQQQTIFSQQLRDSFASNQALNAFPEFQKNKFLTNPQQTKDKSQFKPNSPDQRFQLSQSPNRRYSNNELKIDNQLYSLPTKNLENERIFTPKKKENQILQKQRRLTEFQQQQNSSRNKEMHLDSSSKILGDYDYQNDGDISQLKSSFKEFSVIKKTFKILANIIQFQRDDFYAQGNTESLLKFTKAYKIFNKIQNQQALALCLFNIGKLHSENKRYSEATESFQLSQQICLQQIGYMDIISFQKDLRLGNIINDQFYLNLLKNTCQSFGLLLKQQVQDSIIQQHSINNFHINRQTKERNQILNFNEIFLNLQTQEDNYYCNQKEFIKTIKLSLQQLQLTIDLENKSNPINRFNLQLSQIDIAELLVYLGDVNQSYLKINQLQDELYKENNSTSYCEELFIQSLTKRESKIYSLKLNQLETNFLFIRGLIQMKRRQYYQAAILFTEMIENSISCDPQKKLIALSMIHISFFSAQIDTKYILKFLIKEQHIYQGSLLQSALLNRFSLNVKNYADQNNQDLNQFQQTSFDISFVFQTPSFQSQMQKEFENYQSSFLDWLFKFYLQAQKDRVSILNCYEEDQEPFSKQIDIIQNLNIFQEDKTLKIITSEYQRLYKEYQSALFQQQNQKDLQNFQQILNKSNQTPKNYSKICTNQILRCLQNYILNQRCQSLSTNSQLKNYCTQNNRTHFIIYFTNQLLPQQLEQNSFQKAIKQLQKQNKNIKHKIIIIQPTDLLSYQSKETNKDLAEKIFLERIINILKQNQTTLIQESQILKKNSIYFERGFKIHQFESLSQFKIYLLRKRMHPKNIEYLYE